MMSRDIISSLPDDILVHIISLLETQCAIRTGILSKRWNSIWMKSTSIVLDETDFEAALTDGDMVRSFNGDVIDEDNLYYDQEIRQRYVSMVNGVLLSHIGPVLKDFNISFHGRLGGEQEYLNRWIRHLTTVKKVENLSIAFSNSPELPPYNLSLDLFPCDSITCLVLSGCSIQSFTYCRSFTSIETLVLQDCSVSHDSVTSIFTSFPSLRSCTMEDVCMGSNLSFSAPWLKVLRIMRPVVSASYLEIDAPSLEDLCIFYVEDRQLKLRLRNMQSLTILKLQIPFTGHDSFCGENLVEFRRVKNLTIHVGYLVAIGKWMAQNQEKVPVNQLASLEYLNINDFGLCRMDVNALVSLLQVTPKLQKLIFNDLLPLENRIEDCVDPSFEGLKNLKQIRVTRVDSGSIGRIFLLFFEFLLKYAVSLELLEIEFLDMDESEDMDESSKLAFEKELLALPRSCAPKIQFSSFEVADEA